MSRMDLERALAQQLRDRGATVAETAERLGVSTWTVHALLRRRATFAPRACLLCGTQFVPTNGRQRFCTRAHWLAHRGGPAERECRLCGQPFTPTRENRRYCCSAHQREHQRRQREARTIAALRERERQLEAELAELRAREAA